MPDKEEVRASLAAIIDPEIGVNIVDLGLVYGIELSGDTAKVTMTMTTAACPVADYMKQQVQELLRSSFRELRNVYVEVVWDPPWKPEMMSERAKRKLGVA